MYYLTKVFEDQAKEVGDELLEHPATSTRGETMTQQGNKITQRIICTAGTIHNFMSPVVIPGDPQEQLYKPIEVIVGGNN